MKMKIIYAMIIFVLAYQAIALDLCNYENQTITKSQFLNVNTSQVDFNFKYEGKIENTNHFTIYTSYCNAEINGTSVKVKKKIIPIIIQKKVFDDCMENFNDETKCKNELVNTYQKKVKFIKEILRKNLQNIQTKLKNRDWSWFKNWIIN